MTDCDINYIIGDSTDLNANIIEINNLVFSISDSDDLQYSINTVESINYNINDVDNHNYSLNDNESIVYVIDDVPSDLIFELVDFVVITAVADDLENTQVAFTTRIDVVGDQFIYKGEASPGTADTDAGWRIRRIEFIGEDIETLWAEGSEALSKIWDNHLIYTYS